MDLEQLQAELARREQFGPDLDTVRERVRVGTRSTPGRAAARVHLRRRLAIAASITVFAVLAGGIALAHAYAPADRMASSASAVGGIRWELTSATVSGLPAYGSGPGETESLYLYADGTSVALGFCLTRQGRWHQSGTDLVFDDQHTLDHGCAITVNPTASRVALLKLDRQMTFTLASNTLQLRNSTTTMNLEAAGSIAPAPGTVGAPNDPQVAALTGSAWHLASASRGGQEVALPPAKVTSLELYADGTSSMAGPACFYRTGRWHQIPGGIEFTDQVTVTMFCYLITDERELAGGTVLAALSGALAVTARPSVLTLRNGDTTAVFSNAGPPADGPTSSAGQPTSSAGQPTSSAGLSTGALTSSRVPEPTR